MEFDRNYHGIDPKPREEFEGIGDEKFVDFLKVISDKAVVDDGWVFIIDSFRNGSQELDSDLPDEGIRYAGARMYETLEVFRQKTDLFPVEKRYQAEGERKGRRIATSEDGYLAGMSFLYARREIGFTGNFGSIENLIQVMQATADLWGDHPIGSRFRENIDGLVVPSKKAESKPVEHHVNGQLSDEEGDDGRFYNELANRRKDQSKREMALEKLPASDLTLNWYTPDRIKVAIKEIEQKFPEYRFQTSETPIDQFKFSKEAISVARFIYCLDKGGISKYSPFEEVYSPGEMIRSLRHIMEIIPRYEKAILAKSPHLEGIRLTLNDIFSLKANIYRKRVENMGVANSGNINPNS